MRLYPRYNVGMNFADHLLSKVSKSSPVVLGIDPNFSLMPSCLLPTSTSAGSVEDALVLFSKTVIDACQGLVPAVKLQSAYFEQFGTSGVRALATVLRYANEQGLVTILDVKRGDIGSTSLAYALGYLQGYTQVGTHKYVSDLESDCVTINPFLGEDSVVPFVETAKANNKGLFILVKTSNPGSSLVMDVDCDGAPISHTLGRMLDDLGRDTIGDCGYSSMGAVVGATAVEELNALRRVMPNTLFLMPGIGAQGGSVDLVKQAAQEDGLGAIVPISRGITYPKTKTTTVDAYQDAVRDAAVGFVQLIKEA